jgi:DNA-binding CsgD family transcriptional regulator
MEEKHFNLEFNKIKFGFINKSVTGLPKFERDFYKKLWDFFLLGDSFYFILNHKKFSFEFVSSEVEKVLGYQVSAFDAACLNQIIHPDDHSWFLSFGVSVIDFFSHLVMDKLMKYKVRYDIRLRKMDGNYSRMLYQGILLEHDEQGGFLRTLNVFTDISYLKQEGGPQLSLIGMDGEPSYFNVASNNLYIENREELTRREKQVLKLLIEGKLSKEISSILKISKQTVDTHRKNMIHKKNLNNTGELIGKAIRYGWI